LSDRFTTTTSDSSAIVLGPTARINAKGEAISIAFAPFVRRKDSTRLSLGLDFLIQLNHVKNPGKNTAFLHRLLEIR
jgi:hypothetical protein